MTNHETEFLERWHRELPMYQAWGEFVTTKLTELVADLISPEKVDYFFRIPLKSRIKTEPSLLTKAFYRNKNYDNPYEDIEDKVGLRIVVLFSTDIRIVEEAIKDCDCWTANKARDFEDERANKPFEFDYQSLHYIVRSNEVANYSGVDVKSGIPCEIQVRTILQHAYSELTHDTIYKPSVQAKSNIKRSAAKSMALIEATDDYFTQVKRELEHAQELGVKISQTIDRLYRSFTNLIPELSPLNDMLIDHFKKWATEDFEEDLSKFLDEKIFLVSRIQERASHLLYRQPAVLLIYWAIKQAPRAAWTNSPLTDDELSLFYSDLGKRLPSAVA